jgi:hypothetical protein|tara:strand:- start:389 stop:628 length:240 start_codon:yes stop_codon:yes gene_type:complete
LFLISFLPFLPTPTRPKKKQKEGRGFVCKNTKTHNSLVGKRNNKRKERKDETKKNANSIFCLVKRKIVSKRPLPFETIN